MNSYIAYFIRARWCLLWTHVFWKVDHINLSRWCGELETTRQLKITDEYLYACFIANHTGRNIITTEPASKIKKWSDAKTNLTRGGVRQPTIPYQFSKSFLLLGQCKVFYGSRKSRLAVLWTVCICNHNLGIEHSIIHDSLKLKIKVWWSEDIVIQCHISCQKTHIPVMT
jgi:hypothetical protein